MTRSHRDAMAYPDHPDNASIEVDLPRGLLLLHLGHDWEELPWPFEVKFLEHREWTLLLDGQRLLAGHREALRDEREVRAWLDWARERDVVLDWVSGTGFRYVPRRAGIDLGLVRRRDPEPRPCVRVIGLSTGGGGCLAHGLTVGEPRQVPGGCQLVPALVCDMCWRVAHVQIRPRAHLPIRFTRECRRCRTAVDLLPRWATEACRRRAGQVEVSRTSLPLMGALVDGVRSEVAWVPDPVRTVMGRGRVATVDRTADLAPEVVVPWRDWVAEHPASVEASASAVVGLVERTLPEGMTLGVDVRALTGQVRFEVGE